MATTTTTPSPDPQSPYFDDGSTIVELGQAGYGTPQVSRQTLRLEHPGRPAAIHAAGGGAHDIRLTTGRLRANAGDAERYAHELLTTLATTDHGTLGVRDWRGHDPGEYHDHRWQDAVCVEATATVHAYRWVSLDLRFLAPSAPPPTTTTSGATTTTSWPPSWPAPAPPDTYAGTSTDQDYSAGGVDLGIGGTMELEMVRSVDLRALPRARGARPGAPWRGAAMRYTVSAHVKADSQHLAARCEELARQISAGTIDLSANGNVFNDVILEDLRPDHADRKATSFTATFVREL